LLARTAALLGVLLVAGVLATAGAGWYTSRPEFCRSCHIMEPYYQSWMASTHKDVSCIECHFPPGFGGKVRGKLLGLVQLAKYVTQSEGPRPAAEIPDASCLRSGCHETRLLSGRVDFHGVPFDHAQHLGDLRRGKTLRCTSCHSQIVQGSHMTVTTSTCFLCHFKEGRFNEGLGACTRCHAIPEKAIDLGGGVMFTHELAYQRGVDCANCHGDLIRGRGEVPRERCGVCHNRQEDLAKIDDHVFMHQKHVTEHKIDCLDCHLSIEH
jgi:nitrate/TMAO reductase-like tetraheme cytochrome c subunit